MELDPLGRTALIPFWARVFDATSARPVLGDTAAAALASRVRELYDEFAVDRSTQVGCCLRNLIVDRWLGELVDETTAIVEIGVGLNTRGDRLRTSHRRYVEVDSKPIITLRDKLMPESAAVRVVGDGLDVACWADTLGTGWNGRVIITLEGVLVYQSPDAVVRFFADAAAAFPGAYVVFDRLSPSAVARSNRPGTQDTGRPQYRWPQPGGDRNASGEMLRVVRRQGFMDLPRGLRSHLPARDRVMHALPPRRNAFKLVLCQLPPAGQGRWRT